MKQVILFEKWNWTHSEVGELEIEWFLEHCATAEAIFKAQREAVENP